MAKIEDFGEKIGGARKDLFSGGSLDRAAFRELTEVERKELVHLDNIWPRPDFRKLVEEGMDRGVAFDLYCLRTVLPNTTADYYQVLEETGIGMSRSWKRDKANDPKEQEEFASAMTRVRALCDCKTPKELTEGVKAILEDPDAARILTAEPHRYIEGTRRKKPRPSQRFLKHYHPENLVKDLADEESRSKMRYADERESACHLGWPESTAEIIKFLNRRNLVSQTEEGRWTVKGYMPFGSAKFYLKYDYERDPSLRDMMDENGYDPEKGDFPSPDGIRDFVKVIYSPRKRTKSQSEQEKKAKDNFRRTYLSECIRSGMPDYRNGRDVNEEDFAETFGFRGGEFGNWVNQAERQQSLNHAYDGLCDLAGVLGIPNEGISLEGTLAIAFGARGKGHASAHYEPGRHVINLTKPRGAGSLAHEWFHALDAHLSRKVDELGGKHAPEKWRKDSTTLLTERIDMERGIYPSDMARKWAAATMTARKLAEDTPDVPQSQEFLAVDRAFTAMKECLGITKGQPITNGEVLEKATGKLEVIQKVVSDWGSSVDRIIGVSCGQTFAEELKDGLLGPRAVEWAEKARQEFRKAGGKTSEQSRFFDGLTNNASITESRHDARDRWQLNVETRGAETLSEFRKKTNYGKLAEEKDKGRRKYYSKPEELTARAFETFVYDRLEKSGCRSDYLVHPTHSEPAYIVGTERKAMVAKWEEQLIPAIQGILGKEQAIFEGEKTEEHQEQTPEVSVGAERTQPNPGKTEEEPEESKDEGIEISVVRAKI